VGTECPHKYAWSTTTLAMICNGGNEMGLLFSRQQLEEAVPAGQPLLGPCGTNPILPTTSSQPRVSCTVKTATFGIVHIPKRLHCKNSIVHISKRLHQFCHVENMVTEVVKKLLLRKRSREI